jgi:hypothetical protein
MPNGPRRIVPDVLRMPAFKISNPVEAFVWMKIHDFARKTSACAWGSSRPAFNELDT